MVLGAEQIRRILKKKWRWKRLRRKPPIFTNQKYQEAKKKDWQTLKLWAEQELITLLYLCDLYSIPKAEGYPSNLRHIEP